MSSPRSPLTKHVATAAVLGVFVPSLIGFVALDAVWIGFVAKDFYNDHIAGILRPDVDMVAAALSWLCIVAMNQVFVLPNTVGSKSPLLCLQKVREGAGAGVAERAGAHPAVAQRRQQQPAKAAATWQRQQRQPQLQW